MLRLLLLGLGWCFAVMAIAGVILPLLPATPFALLAAACFARSSARSQRLLMASPLLGALLREWRTYRGLTLGMKLRAGLFTGITALASAVGQATQPCRMVAICLGCLTAWLVIAILPTAVGRTYAVN